MGAPCKGGAAEEAVEETGVEGFEDFVEIVVVAGGGGEALAAAGLADVLGLFGDGFGGDVAAVAVGVVAGDGERSRVLVAMARNGQIHLVCRAAGQPGSSHRKAR